MTRRPPKTAEEIMTRRVYTLSPEASVVDAAQTLLRLGYSGAPVTDEHGNVLGIFSEQDSLRVLTQAAYEGWPSGTVADHMTSEVDSVAPGDDLPAVSTHLSDGKHRRVLVIDDGRLLGVISRRDLIRALERVLAPSRPPTIYEIFNRPR
ncbi:MAG: CBS domain-containing protein [Myxococcales bacterium]|nr:CBS domain-containing protein [Myxococcales bacterium]